MVRKDTTGSVTRDTMSDMRNISEMALLWLQIMKFNGILSVILAQQIDAA
jgi:hypothetical protein